MHYLEAVEKIREEQMDEKKAREILGSDIQDDESLYCLGRYLYWNKDEKNGDAVLDAEFSVDELEAIAWWMRNKA